jgi:hypothetical protein
MDVLMALQILSINPSDSVYGFNGSSAKLSGTIRQGKAQFLEIGHGMA